MPNVGAVSCTFVHDRQGSIPAAIRQRSQKWQVAGIDGTGVALLGKGDAAFTVTAVFYSSDAGVDLWAVQLQALQGTIVSILDDHGDAHSNCFLDKVHNVVKTAARQPGSGITTRGEIAIEGEKVN